MTYSGIAGILITDLILNEENPLAKVYSPSRFLPLSLDVLQSVGEEVSHTVQGYKDVIPGVGTDSIGIEDMCSGAVIQKGLTKVAVYKDERGFVHHFSAICPHMKAVVKWNPIDGTFDCPAHGSIFDHDGKLIQAPAEADLPPHEE